MCVCVCVCVCAGVEKDFKESGRYKETEENKAIFTVKEKAIEVLDLLFNFRFYIRLQVSLSCQSHDLSSQECSSLVEIYI